jgi:hypothetical protein
MEMDGEGIERDWVAERDPVGAMFAGLDSSQGGHLQDIPFATCPGLDRFAGGRLHGDECTSDSATMGVGFIGDFHHDGSALRVEMVAHRLASFVGEVRK